MEKKKKAIIFDLDGTLVLSTESGLTNIRKILEKYGVGRSPEQDQMLLNWWGLATGELLQIAYGVSHDLAMKMSREWESAGSVPPLVEGVDGLMEYNRKNDLINVLMTSREDPSGRDILEHHGYLKDFSFIEQLGGKMIRKPDPRAFITPLLFLRDALGISRDECLYVGDTIVDFRCGTAAGVKTVIVLSGPCTRENALNHGVSESCIIQSVAQLPEWLDANTN